jgi:hypothetical protein
VNPASAGRRAITRPDPAGDWTARCIVTSAESLLAIVTIASTADLAPLDLHEKLVGGTIARAARTAA